MKSRTFQLAIFLFLVSMGIPQLAAAPVINSVMNAASNTDPRMPNGSIVPGGIFIIKGTGL
jgi:hypothetical protein